MPVIEPRVLSWSQVPVWDCHLHCHLLVEVLVAIVLLVFQERAFGTVMQLHQGPSLAGRRRRSDSSSFAGLVCYFGLCGFSG